MPEGPEVEIVRRELEKIVGKTIVKIHLTPLSQKYSKYQNKQQTYSCFKGKKLHRIERFGKFLVWRFDNTKESILNHLGMSGRWCFSDSYHEFDSSISHPKIILQMNAPPHGIFDDVRNFGQFKVFSSYEDIKSYPAIKSLGIDGLATPFPLEEFLALISKKSYENRKIGEVLLNQKLVAGVGNIYKSEALFRAGIHPLREVNSISDEEKEQLGLAIGKTLQLALNDGGSTFGGQPYTRPSGNQGEAQNWHKVYNKEKKPCKQCETKIQKIVQTNRSTYFCPKCQKISK